MSARSKNASAASTAKRAKTEPKKGMKQSGGTKGKAVSGNGAAKATERNGTVAAPRNAVKGTSKRSAPGKASQSKGTQSKGIQSEKTTSRKASTPVATKTQGEGAKSAKGSKGVNGTARGNASKGAAASQAKGNAVATVQILPLPKYARNQRPDNATLLSWYELMHMGRILDEKAANYLKQAKGWSYHAPCAGHEGIQLALGVAFRQKQDYLFPYYRDLMTSLAAGITPYEIILNGLSKDADVAGGGRHMSNHFAKPELHIQNGSSCTGNQAQHAAGLGKAVRYYNADSVVFCSSGESATAEGYYYEAVNGVTTGKYPVVFVVQNNKYGISVPIEEVNANPNVSKNFSGFANFRIIECDGTDVIDSWRAIQESIAFAKSGKGGAMVHADCVRIGSHSNSDRHELYRSDEELVESRRRDPVARLRRFIIDEKIATDEQLTALEKENRRKMLAAADEAEAQPDPDPASFREFAVPEPYDAQENASSEGEELSLLESINQTLKEEFRRNPDTFMWGQDVATKEKGGIFNVSKGMQQEFGWGRVHNSPIAEDYIVGSANGFSRFNDEIRLVIEGAEFADYFWPAMEQTVEMGHEYWRTRGQFSPNVTLRLASGGYITGGLYHSQTIEATLQTLPGFRIVYPAFADDAAGLLRTCMRSRGPSFFLEPKFLYNHRWARAVVPKDFEVPFGKARVRREGDDLTIISYGNAIHLSLAAAEKLSKEKGVEATVLDLRSIKPLDEEAMIAAAKRTNRVLVAHEDHTLGGVGGEVAAIITSEAFGYLDAPVMRVGSAGTPIGFAPNLERAILLSADQVFDKAVELIEY